jgi:nucleotide-binding universal stress UspA family protein
VTGKIVVGVDGSPGSREALRWALAEARLRDGVVHVVHAWMVPLIDALPEPWVVGSRPLGPSDDEMHDHLEAAAQGVLAVAVDQARSADPSVEVHGELAEARPGSALLAAAEDADLLVVGSRGRGGFAGLVLGSVSAECAHHAPCPVVVVPAGGTTA